MGEALGSQYEIVLHDLSDLDHSIAAIENSHISGRSAGDPATDLLLSLLKSNEDDQSFNYMTNYRGYSKTGKTVKGSTFLIRDEDNEIIGAICINMEISVYLDAYNALNEIVGSTTEKENNDIAGGGYAEKLGHSIEDITTEAITTILEGTEIPPERMLAEEKMQIMHQLNQKGIFLLKGAVSEIAKHLKVSEPTIYRYLNKVT
jgi:predicted transcriptional regulator YheO